MSIITVTYPKLSKWHFLKLAFSELSEMAFSEAVKPCNVLRNGEKVAAAC